MTNPKKTLQTYDRWSSFYDKTFGTLLEKRLRRSIFELRLVGGEHILDMGVGTGVILPHYPRNVQVTGLDLSAGMLRQAHRKVRRLELNHIHLVQADAVNPPFADEAFDHILLTHVLSVVHDPDRLLRWCARLVKPTGKVVIVNHFRSPQPAVAVFEKALNPLCRRLGWRSDMALSDLVRRSPLRMDYQFKLNPVDLWHIVVMSRHDAPPQHTQPSPINLPAAQITVPR
jgi:phosphatidylethanolamine/phosphatidyl-N-methylethanolamine N-methyltransferase